MGPDAGQNDRVAALWAVLDPRNDGSVDRDGLKRGLEQLERPLQDADAAVAAVLAAVDTNRDGRIQYSDFASFVRQSDARLTALFGRIDRNKDGRLDKAEVGSAFRAAGLPVPTSTLDAFFASVDANHDGIITFDEWRDFLLFVPTTDPSLTTVLRYVSATLKVTHDADTVISDDVMKGVGYFVAGGAAGIISRTATAPLDRLRVYLIAQTGSAVAHSEQALRPAGLVQAGRNVLSPLLNASTELWKTGGMRSLFAGNGLNILKIMPETAIKFGCYEALKQVFANLQGQEDVNHIDPRLGFLAGGLSGMAAQLVSYPIDTLKFRMQCEMVSGGPRGNQLILQTFRKMWSTGGTSQFYRGLTMGLVGMFPYAAIDLSIFEALKRRLTARNARSRHCSEADAHPGSFATALIGGLSGAVGASVIYPINVLRTRLQAQGTVLHPPRYNGIVDVARQTIRREGAKGLFRGLTPNLFKVVPSVSITYVVYENAKRVMSLP